MPSFSSPPTRSVAGSNDRIDPRDERIDVRAKFALARMRDSQADRREAAVRLIRAVNDGQLVFGDDLRRAGQIASGLSTVRWKLVAPTEDASLVLDRADPLRLPAAIIFRGDTPDISKTSDRLDAALARVGRTFELWQTGRLTRCDRLGVSAAPLTTVMPPGFCEVSSPQGTSNGSITLISHPLLYLVWASSQRGRRGGRLNAEEIGSLDGLSPEDCINFDDDRVPVAATLTVPFRCICSICVQFSLGGDGPDSVTTGTGILVSPRHVLTCSHVVTMLTLKGNEVGASGLQ
jgi:V8-like Glu-specific endopeptidase